MSTQPPGSPTPQKPFRPTAKARAVAVLLALMGVGAVFTWGLRQPPKAGGSPRGEIARSILPEAGHPSNKLAHGGARVDSWPESSRLGPAHQTAQFPDAAPLPGGPADVRPQATWPWTVNPTPPETAASTQTDPGPIAVPPPRLPAPETLGQGQSVRVYKPPTAFTDVPTGYWARAIVADLAAKGLIAGYPDGSFKPDQPVSRAEFAVQLAKCFKVPVQDRPVQFPDVPLEFWASQDVRQAVQMGFLQGLPEGLFEPERPISRAEVLVAIAQGLNLTSTAPADVVLQRYLDRDDIPAWAIPGIAKASQVGLVANHPDLARLEPNRPATRAEVAAILRQTLVYLGEAQALSSP